MERAGLHNLVEEEAGLEEGELTNVTSPLDILLFSVRRCTLMLNFGPIRLRRFRSGHCLFGRVFRYLESSTRSRRLERKRL